MLKKICVLTCFAFFALCVSVLAAPIENVTQNFETGGLTVKGELYSEGVFSIQVLKVGKNPEELKNLKEGSLSGVVQTMDVYESNCKDFVVDIVLGEKAESGAYLLRLNGGGMVEPYEFFYENYFSIAEIKKLLEEIKNGDKEKIRELLDSSKNRKLIGLKNDKVYDDLSDAMKDAIADRIYNNKYVIDNVDNFKGFLVESVAFIGIGYAADAGTVLGILDEFKGEAGFEKLGKYEDFQQMDEAGKLFVAKRLIGKNLFENTDYLFNEAVVLAELESTSGAAEFRKIMEKNKDIFDNDVVIEYTNLSDSYSIDRKIIEKIGSIYSFSELVKMIDENMPVKTKPNSGGGSSGGGGSGGLSVTSQGFTAVTGNKNPFSDISEVTWAKEAILTLYNKSIINGKNEEMFFPQDFVKREEFAKMLVNAFEIESEGGLHVFEDVKETEWYYPFVTIAYQTGIVKGKSEKLFGVGDYITRQDMAVMIYRIVKDYQVDFEKNNVLGFNDKIEISNYAKEAVAFLRAAGIVSGMSDGSFRPNEPSTRAQAALVIYKTMEFAEGVNGGV